MPYMEQWKGGNRDGHEANLRLRGDIRLLQTDKIDKFTGFA